MKKCIKCLEEKSTDQFSFRNKFTGQYNSWCRPCTSSYDKKRYENPSIKQRFSLRGKEAREDRKAKMIAYLDDKFCSDCGESDSVVLQFDHKENKVINIADAVRRAWSWDHILGEIAKCDIRCANCHQRKTAKQFGWYKLQG